MEETRRMRFSKFQICDVRTDMRTFQMSAGYGDISNFLYKIISRKFQKEGPKLGSKGSEEDPRGPWALREVQGGGSSRVWLQDVGFQVRRPQGV